MSYLGRLEAELRDSRAHAKRIEEQIGALAGQSVRIDHSIPLPRTGVDCSFSHPDYSKLKRAGVTFVGRYLTGAGKALTRDEAVEISDNGLDIFVIFETVNGRMSEGYDAGVYDAVVASHAIKDLNPRGRPPIYFTCDFDAEGDQIGKVLEYIRGAVHEIGWTNVGLYAGYNVIAAAHAEHRCRFLYQTLAWSDGRWFPGAQLRQTVENVSLLGGSVDIDKAVSADFGQFRV